MSENGMSATGMPLVAWEVDINSMTAITFAKTAAAARWNTVRAYWDAGFGRQGKWPNAKAKRVPELDQCPLKDREPRKCWVPEYVRSYP